MVRAKFKLVRYETSMGSYYMGVDEQKKPIYESGEVRSLVLQPVTSGSEENKQFFASTPTGEIKLNVINKDAWGHFELDREYYVDFTPA